MSNQNFVWAIDADGKPTKCTAKPENRGKGRCPHKIHNDENLPTSEFFKKYVGKTDPESEPESNMSKIQRECLEDLKRRYEGWVDFDKVSTPEGYREEIESIISDLEDVDAKAEGYRRDYSESAYREHLKEIARVDAGALEERAHAINRYLRLSGIAHEVIEIPELESKYTNYLDGESW